jgi:putative DNA primase/helicase
MPILKIRRIQDLSTDSYLDEIQFEDTAGATKTIRLSPSVIQDARQFQKHLLDAGADLPTDWQQTRELLHQVAASRPEVQSVLARRPGWANDGKAYVRADKVIGQAGNLVGSPRSKPDDPHGNILRRGDTNSWKRNVAIPAKASSAFILGISTAFASALVKMTGQESFGFCISAPSRYGKTVATLVAGSVVGLGSHQQLLTWNRTDARLQEQLPEFNHCATLIDDLKSMRGSDRHKYTRVASLAYIFSTGAGTGRHSTFGQLRDELWKTILFTSNEHSIVELLGAADWSVMPGRPFD